MRQLALGALLLLLGCDCPPPITTSMTYDGGMCTTDGQVWWPMRGGTVPSCWLEDRP